MNFKCGNCNITFVVDMISNSDVRQECPNCGSMNTHQIPMPPKLDKGGKKIVDAKPTFNTSEPK